MEKREKHQKLQQFRSDIASVLGRKAAISEIIKNLKANNGFSELDELKVIVLTQKKSYLAGCEEDYKDFAKVVFFYGSEKLKAAVAKLKL